jgi:hypothetical protein
VDHHELRHHILLRFAETGAPPSFADLAGAEGKEVAAAALQRLAGDHSIVLEQDQTEIRMAMPFSAVPTPWQVVAGEQHWYANCAWDALAIPASLGRDATIDAVWEDTQQPVDLAVTGDVLSSSDGFIHFAVPARHWWDDIVFT